MANNEKIPSSTPTQAIPTLMTKEEFVAFIKKILHDPEHQFSWIVVNNKIFDWVAINNNHLIFIEELSKTLKTTSYNEAYVGIFEPHNKTTQYLSFKITE